MVSWGPGTTVIDNRLLTEGRIQARVPLSAIFKPGVAAPQALSRQAPLRAAVDGHGE